MRLTKTQARIPATLLGCFLVSAMSISPLSSQAVENPDTPAETTSINAAPAVSSDSSSATPDALTKESDNELPSDESAEPLASNTPTPGSDADKTQSTEDSDPLDDSQSLDLEQSEDGRTAFFNAGATIFPEGVNTCEPGIMWELGSQGEVRKIVNGMLATTYDIPYGVFRWGECGILGASSGSCPADSKFNSYGVGFAPEFIRPGDPKDTSGNLRTAFDAFGRYSGGMFALQSKPLTNLASAPTGDGVVIHQYRNPDEKWYALTRTGSAILNEWQQKNGVSITAPPENIRTGTTGTSGTISPSFIFTGGNYTFNNAFTSFSMGTALSDGTYIFGGTGRPPVTGGKGTDIKLFARKPDGTILYLGYFPVPGLSNASHTGDIVADKDGNLYVATGSVFYGTNPASEKIIISRLTAETIQDRMFRPAARWNGSSWVAGDGSNFSHNTNQYRGTSTGTNTVAMTAQNVHSMNLLMPSPFDPTQFAGFDITPTGNIVIGTRADYVYYSSGATGGTGNNKRLTVGLFYEYDKDGNRIGEGYSNRHYNPIYNWDRNYGTANREITDMSGCVTAPPLRTITVYKTLEERTTTTDQFVFTAEISNNGLYRKLTGETKGNETGRRMEIGITKERVFPGAQVILTESGKDKTKLTSYSTRLDCYDRDANAHLLGVEEITGKLTIPLPPANYDSSNAQGIWCTFTNKPKVQVDFLLTKRDASNNALLKDIPFTLYKDNGTGNAHDPAQKIPTQASGNITTPTTNVGGQITWSKVDPGVYWLVEGNVPGYEPMEPQKVVLENGQASKEITLTNTRKTGTLNIEKISAGDRTKLAGSKWRLRGTTDAAARYDKTITDFAGNGAAPSTSNDANNAAGVIQVNDLPWGKYILTEEEAPAGFERSTQQWEFAISATTLVQNFVGNQAIVNTPYSGPAIPFTGGLGRDGFIIGGIILLGGAAGVSWAFGRKRRPVPSETDVPNAQ